MVRIQSIPKSEFGNYPLHTNDTIRLKFVYRLRRRRRRCRPFLSLSLSKNNFHLWRRPQGASSHSSMKWCSLEPKPKLVYRRRDADFLTTGRVFRPGLIGHAACEIRFRLVACLSFLCPPPHLPDYLGLLSNTSQYTRSGLSGQRSL